MASDTIAKRNAAQYLATLGYTNPNFASGRGNGFDIEARKDGQSYFFEVKSSQKMRNGSTVMHSELEMARKFRDRYFFVICNGFVNSPITEWTFEVLSADEFLSHVFFDSPLWGYRFNMYKKPRRTTPASWVFIEAVTTDWNKWKAAYK